MPVLLIRQRATQEEIKEMLRILEDYIKVAVDVHQKILAGGGVMHADCEAALLESGSEPAHIWGANWDPKMQTVEFEALINIRPRANNRSMIIQDPKICAQVEAIIRNFFQAKESAA